MLRAVLVEWGRLLVTSAGRFYNLLRVATAIIVLIIPTLLTTQVELFVGSPSRAFADHTFGVGALISILIVMIYALTTLGAAIVLGRAPTVRIDNGGDKHRYDFSVVPGKDLNILFRVRILNGRKRQDGVVVKVLAMRPTSLPGLPAPLRFMGRDNNVRQTTLRRGEILYVDLIQFAKHDSASGIQAGFTLWHTIEHDRFIAAPECHIRVAVFSDDDSFRPIEVTATVSVIRDGEDCEFSLSKQRPYREDRPW